MTNLAEKLINFLDFLNDKLISNKRVIRRYIQTGKEFGDSMSYLGALGRGVHFETEFMIWKDWEEEYAKRGFRTIPFNEFMRAGGYDKNISHLIGIKRQANEEPVLYSKEVEEKVFN